MKKLYFILAVLTVMLAITSCGGIGEILDKPLGGGTKKFWAHNIDTGMYYQIEAEKFAENTRCVVWVDKKSGVNKRTAEMVASAYNDVYDKMISVFGWTKPTEISDSKKVNMNTMDYAHWIATEEASNARLTILLLDIKDGYLKEGDPYVAGYFQPLNIFENDPEDDNYKYSNALDMIYLDTYPSEPGSPDSNETLAHEMQHLMNFVTRIKKYEDGDIDDFDIMDTWIDEGLSTAAEWVYSGEHPEIRWAYYNTDPSGLIKLGNNFYVWDNHDDNPQANLDDYATAYLFFQYLRLQKNEGIYKSILNSKFYNYKAVTYAAGYNDDWSRLLLDWLSANYINNNGTYGYMNDPTLKQIKAPMVPSGYYSLPLYPGEGVYSKSNGSRPSGSGNIKYEELTSSSGTARLTYNTNTNFTVDENTGKINSTPETGLTTGIAPSVGISIPGSGSVQINQKKFTGPFKVDASYFLRRNKSGGMHNEIRNLISRSVSKGKNTLRFDLSTLERVSIDE